MKSNLIKKKCKICRKFAEFYYDEEEERYYCLICGVREKREKSRGKIRYDNIEGDKIFRKME